MSTADAPVEDVAVDLSGVVHIATVEIHAPRGKVDAGPIFECGSRPILPLLDASEGIVLGESRPWIWH